MISRASAARDSDYKGGQVSPSVSVIGLAKCQGDIIDGATCTVLPAFAFLPLLLPIWPSCATTQQTRHPRLFFGNVTCANATKERAGVARCVLFLPFFFFFFFFFFYQWCVCFFSGRASNCDEQFAYGYTYRVIPFNYRFAYRAAFRFVVTLILSMVD